jgi:hypothetical protein
LSNVPYLNAALRCDQAEWVLLSSKEIAEHCFVIKPFYYGAFANLRKATVSVVMSVRPIVDMEQPG